MDSDKQINQDNCLCIIIKNKNDNNTNKFIPQLLNGKSETQVNNHWTKEEDDIIIKNRNGNNSYEYIATLLNGKSENQVRTRSSKLIEKEYIATLLNGVLGKLDGTGTLIRNGTLDRKGYTWPKEEDDVIIKNKKEKKTNKHIATLLEGKSLSQVQYRSLSLIEKGTLKTVAKKCLWTKEEDDIIFKNKKEKKTNKHIATLLEGKSESQVQYRSLSLINKGTFKTVAKKCLWTEEEDAIIISNKNEKKSNKHIATLLPGKSFIQVNNRSRFLINKGTLKTVAKKKKAPVTKTRIAPKATKYRFPMKRKIDDSCNDSLEQKYKPTPNKKHKSMDEREDSSSDIDSSDNESSDDSSSDVEADDWFHFSKALDTNPPDDVVSENIPTKPRNNIWMNGMNGMNVKVKVEESVEVVEVVEETMTNISDCQPDDVVSENIPTKPKNNIWMGNQNVTVKVEESVEVVEETMTNISDCQPDNVVSENIPTKPRNNIWMGKQYVTVKVEETVGGSMKENLE